MPYEVQTAATFDAWLNSLTDKIARKAIVDRIVRIESGLLGDHKSVGDKVGELRVDVGQGYRLYYTIRGGAVVHLLRGGSKKTQKTDIRKAEATVKTMNRAKKDAGGSRVRERQTGYAAECDEPVITDEDITFAPFDAADYMRGDEEMQFYILRNALADGHPAYIANAIGAVARARGLSKLERATGIKRQTLNKSLSLKGNPTLETLVTVLGALGLRLEIVGNRASTNARRSSRTRRSTRHKWAREPERLTTLTDPYHLYDKLSWDIAKFTTISNQEPPDADGTVYALLNACISVTSLIDWAMLDLKRAAKSCSKPFDSHAFYEAAQEWLPEFPLAKAIANTTKHGEYRDEGWTDAEARILPNFSPEQRAQLSSKRGQPDFWQLFDEMAIDAGCHIRFRRAGVDGEIDASVFLANLASGTLQFLDNYYWPTLDGSR